MPLDVSRKLDRASSVPPSALAEGERRSARVGDFLRHTYDEVVVEPLPDIFADLLRKLD